VRKGSATTRYRFIGGKGGVGKTTCAAAIAVTAAASGLRTLAISTDPAPSLGDAFDRPLGASPRRVPLRRGSLHGVEIDAPRALERWLADRRDALERIALRGTWLDAEDVARLLRLSLPGIDELAALLEIARYGRSGRYDLIVVDTAPTGHTLRMLAMPGTLRNIAQVFDHMQARHRMIVETLRGGWAPDAEDALIDELDTSGQELAVLLRDPASVTMSWVTLPEPMSVEETSDGIASLQSQGIPFPCVLVNRVTPRPLRACRRCDARIAFERRTIAALRGSVPHDVRLVGVAARDTEPRGPRALGAIGKEIEAAAPLAAVRSGRAVRWRAETRASTPARSPAAIVDIPSTFAGDRTRLLLFGGKGGVGKTTCAAAAALALAAGFPSRRILLLSADPAHSLGDALGLSLSDGPAQLDGGPPNLWARELDAAAGFRRVREKYAAAIDSVFDRLTRGSSSGLDARHDRQVMHDLIELAPPGIDELAAIIDVTDALERAGGHDLIVMDTAPSGHAVRLLEMPALVQEWAKALMSILLKYQPIVGVGGLGAVALKLSQGLGRLRELLRDPERTSFVVVTRAAALPRAETVRLISRLRRMGIAVPAVVVNALGRGTCTRCRRAGAIEQREVHALARALSRRRVSIATTPAQVPPPHGIAELHRWQRMWSLAGSI